MANRNIFEMLGLEFDPPDNLKKIRAAHENWKKRLTAELNTTVETARLTAIKAELAMDNYITQAIENPRLRQREAKALRDARVEQLRLYIDIQRGETSGTLQVNQSQIKQIKDKLKLSVETIETTYIEQGFEIKKERTEKAIAATLNAFFISDAIMAELKKNFADFQTVPDEKNYAWSANVHDFYELAYYLEGQIEPAPDFYKRRDTDELREIFRNEAKKVSSPIPAWQSIKALLNLAQTQIFNSDENRFKYDHSLKIETLNDFFAKIKAAPELFKRDKYFADNCINRIRRTFQNFLNYELSAALYNKAAGLLKDPYESTSDTGENFYCLTCVNCGSFESFRTREEAELAVCKVCGENFYIECPKCGKKIPSAVEHCPFCEFSLTELRRYNHYVDQANAMLDLVERAKNFAGDIEAVMSDVIEIFTKAKLVKPEAPELIKIEWRINKIATAFKNRALKKWAEEKLPSLSTPPDTAVSDCMEILRRIKDYKPARERLRLIQPKRPLNITAVIKKNLPKNPASNISKISVNAKTTSLTDASSNLVCIISWQPDSDLGVVYTLIKKINGIPENQHDGEIVIENTDKIEVEDTNINSGVMYGYAVFAVRLGSFSEPATCKVVYYSDLDENKLIAKTEDGHCTFIWKLPSENCLGLRILRSDRDGNNVVVADCVQSPFVDRLVKNRKQYQYCLQCVYYSAEETVANMQKFIAEANKEKLNKVWKVEHALKYSEGLTVTLTPELPPRLIKNLDFQVADGRVRFTWQNSGDFVVWFKEIVDAKKVQIQPNTTFDLDKIDELLGNGLVFKRAESSDQICEFDMTSDLMKIAVISATHHLGIVNEIVTVADIEPCEIDADKTKIMANQLKLVLKTLPKNIYMIHYKVSNEDSDELYATVEEAKARHLNRIYATKYEHDTSISQAHLPQKKLYITVIGEYKLSDGSTAYSEPSTIYLNNRPRAEISYWLEWGMSGLFTKTPQAKNCKLVIESQADFIPKLFLACRKDGLTNIDLKNSVTKVLEEVPEQKKGLKNGRLEIFLSDEIWDEVLSGANIKLLTLPEEERYFFLKAAKPETLTVPKK